jgi:hypothetical protein
MPCVIYLRKKKKCAKNTEALLRVSKEDGPEVNKKKMKYMFMSHHQKTGQKHNLMTDNKYLKR